jgi:thiamine monophosphate kinase
VSVQTSSPKLLADYGRACAHALARAHSRTGDRIAIAGYLGTGDAADTALTCFAEAYADQNERDYAALREAVGAGRVTAQSDL